METIFHRYAIPFNGQGESGSLTTGKQLLDWSLGNQHAFVKDYDCVADALDIVQYVG